MQALYTKWLVFKSIRGLERPWLVFSPEERKTCPHSVWSRGFATWRDALAYVQYVERSI